MCIENLTVHENHYAGGDNPTISSQKCLWNSICQEYEKLKSKLESLQPNQHINLLARPKFRRKKFCPKPIKKFERKREVVREHVASTRLQQLALVQVRKLIALRDAKKHLLDKTRLDRLNRYIRKSVLSLYSRLSNANPPEDKLKISKWTSEDWKKHEKWLRINAAPKKPKQPPPIKRIKKPLSEFLLLDKLAKPKKRYEYKVDPFKVSKGAQMYEATERITNLANPKKRRSDIYYKEPFKVSRAALKHKPSERTASLATPREKKIATTDLKERPFEVVPEALKARATKRTKELANPKRIPPKEPFNPFKVNPKALKAEPTPRILELSKPRKVK